MLAMQVVNLVGPLFFLGRFEAWVVLAAYFTAAGVILTLHRRLGWVRLLGIGHFVWLPMLPWLILRGTATGVDGLFALWLFSVVCIDGISLVIDIVDVLRYLGGDRRPIVASAGG
jgi:hypothetical protein